MKKIIAIDYGQKRSGIAITDAMQIIASGLCTVPTSELLAYLKDLFVEESIAELVVGLPKQMNNTPSESEAHIQHFLKEFALQFPNMPVHRVDERFTSKMATQAMLQGGLKKKQRQNKAMVDQVSATIILQTYLDSKP